jgi:hypothetical protein
VLRLREAISRRRCLLKMWHRRLRRLLEEPQEPMVVTVGEAAATAGGEGDGVLPEPAMEVVVHSPKIQDAEPIFSAPMSEAVTSSRGGLELLAHDLVDLAMVARHLEAMRQAEQWMMVSSRHP